MGIDHGFIAGGRSTDPSHRVQIGSIQTVARRLDRLPPPDLIVFDEAHHTGAAQWQQIYDAFPQAKKIGLTATPWRLDGKSGSAAGSRR
jgi:DNA repair protein RadD